MEAQVFDLGAFCVKVFSCYGKALLWGILAILGWVFLSVGKAYDEEFDAVTLLLCILLSPLMFVIGLINLVIVWIKWRFGR